MPLAQVLVLRGAVALPHNIERRAGPLPPQALAGEAAAAVDAAKAQVL
jgi:hypothetical protein